MNKIKEKHKNTPDGKYILKYQYTNILEEEIITTQIEIKKLIKDKKAFVYYSVLGTLLGLIYLVALTGK